MEESSTLLVEAPRDTRMEHILRLLDNRRSATTVGGAQPLITEVKETTDYKNLNWMPTELLKDVIDLKSDLQNLCLVNKRVNKNALPVLYRDIHLNLSTDLSTITNAMTRGNTGIDAIRSITVSYHGEDPRYRDMKFSFRMLIMFLRFLPKDSLKDFVWLLPTPIPEEVNELVLQTQRKLRQVYVHEHVFRKLSPPSLYTQKPYILQAMKDAKSLFVVPKTAETLALAAQVMKQLPRLGKLTVNFRNFSLGDDDLDDDVTRVWDSIRETLLQSFVLMQAPHMPIRLRLLELSDVSLSLCGSTWCQFLDLGALSDLLISYCTRPDLFLDVLCDKGAPKLQTFLLVHEVENTPKGSSISPYRLLKASLDHFLKEAAGCLWDLRLHLRNVPNGYSLPEPDCITLHGSTLEHLVINMFCTSNKEAATYGYEDLKKVLIACHSITQLGIAMPEHHKRYYDSPFQTSMDLIAASLPHLEILNIHTWPYAYEFREQISYDCAPYMLHATVEKIASEVFTTYHSQNSRDLCHLTCGIQDKKRSNRWDPLHFKPTRTFADPSKIVANSVEYDGWERGCTIDDEILIFELEYGKAPRREKYKEAYRDQGEDFDE